MESASSSNSTARLDRELANLKLVSRLLGHELAAQNGPRLTLSRDQVEELQTAIDLFIEEAQQFRGAPSTLHAISGDRMGSERGISATTPVSTTRVN